MKRVFLGSVGWWVAGLVTVAALGGCAGQGESSEPSPIAEPVDLSAFRAKPCDAVPASMNKSFGMERRDSNDNRPLLKGDGPQPACVLAERDETRSLVIRFHLANRPVQLLSSTGHMLSHQPVGDYPAATWSTARVQEPTTSRCTVLVDMATSSGLSATYTDTGQTDKNACASARRAGRTVVTHLAR